MHMTNQTVCLVSSFDSLTTTNPHRLFYLIIRHLITRHSLWDLGLANLRDSRAEVPHIEALDLGFVEEFRAKTIALLDLLNELWPETHKMYRLCHNVRETVGDW